MAQSQENEDYYVLWHYRPSLALAIVATILFFILFAAHCWRLIRSRAWFCIPFVVGSLFEIIGYAGRAAAHFDTERLTPYIIQSLLLLLAPILFAASVYMILGRLVRAVNASSYSLIPVKWLTKIFVGGDVFCFCIQGAGGGLMAKASSMDGLKMGENIILGGLILQIIVFLVFVAVAGVFHSRLNNRPTAEAMRSELPWQRMLWLLYVTSILITTRNIFRVIEYGMGSNGYLLTHEWTLYVFDGLLMVFVLAICLTWYIGSIRKRSDKDVESMNKAYLQPSGSQ